MIFITLGTQRFQFDRVLKEIDKLIENMSKIVSKGINMSL